MSHIPSLRQLRSPRACSGCLDAWTFGNSATTFQAREQEMEHNQPKKKSPNKIQQTQLYQLCYIMLPGQQGSTRIGNQAMSDSQLWCLTLGIAKQCLAFLSPNSQASWYCMAPTTVLHRRFTMASKSEKDRKGLLSQYGAMQRDFLTQGQMSAASQNGGCWGCWGCWSNLACWSWRSHGRVPRIGKAQTLLFLLEQVWRKSTFICLWSIKNTGMLPECYQNCQGAKKSTSES